MNEGKVSTRLGLPGNPNIAESIMVFRDLKLAELTGAQLHVPHVSTADSVKHIYEMKNSFEKVTAEVTPHHLFFSDESLQYYNTDLKVAPPIRDDLSRKALIKAIKDGTIEPHKPIGGHYYAWIQVIICKCIKQGFGDNEILKLIKEVHKDSEDSPYVFPESYKNQINYTRGQRQLNKPRNRKYCSFRSK